MDLGAAGARRPVRFVGSMEEMRRLVRNSADAPAQSRRGDLTEGNILKNIILFALPLVAGQIFQNLYHSVDSIVVGRCVGTSALAAVTPCSDISQLLVGFFTGLSVGSGVAFSRYFGSRDHDRFHRAVHTALTFSAIMGGVMVAAGILASPLLLRVVDCPGDIFPEALVYLRIYLVGVLFTAVYNIQAGILRSVGDSRTPFAILVISSFLNIVLDLLFVAVLPMGVAGVAAATILAQFVSVLLVTIRMLRTADIYKLAPRELGIDRAILWEILRQGIPAAFQSCLITFSNLFVQRYINSFGAYAMAGTGVGKKVDDYVGMITVALAHSTTTYVSQCAGAGKYGRAYRGIRYVICLDIAVVVTLAVPIFLFAREITTLFTDDPNVQYYAVMMIRTFMPAYVLQAFHQIFSNAVRGFGRSAAAMVTTMTGLIICRQLYLAVAMSLSHHIRLVFLSWPVGWIFSALLAFSYYWGAIRRKHIP